jgi:hypothetical protein
MTPKDYAKELVDKFRKEFDWVESQYAIDLYRDTRQCALIAVDEIINTHLLSEKDIFGTHPVDYWNEVKQEIEKL